MPSPIDYRRPHRSDDAPPRRDGEPRLSKLAVAAAVCSLGQLLSCPMMCRIGTAARLPPVVVATVLPVCSFILSCVALLRILRRMERLRGEGLAITGVIVSFVLFLLAAIAASGR